MGTEALGAIDTCFAVDALLGAYLKLIVWTDR
jgi:hypothetical protein